MPERGRPSRTGVADAGRFGRDGMSPPAGSGLGPEWVRHRRAGAPPVGGTR
jgi:hypothetical protein